MSEEKLKLTVDTFENTVRMMNSPDQENIVVALECIENVDFKENLTYIILVTKFANVTADIWKKHAPESAKKLESIGMELSKPMNYKKMLQILIKYKVPDSDLQFFFNKFEGNLKESIKSLGYDFIDDIKITLKLKDKQHEPISESSSI